MALATRDRILDAARLVFTDAGYQGASMRKIAKRADITHAAIYKHFADKDALLCALAEHDFAELVATIASRVDTGDRPIERLATVLREFILLGIGNPRLYEFLFQILPSLPGRVTDAGELARSRLRSRVEACVEGGDLTGDPEMLADFVATAAHGYISRTLARGPETNSPGDLDAYVRFVIAGARHLDTGSEPSTEEIGA